MTEITVDDATLEVMDGSIYFGDKFDPGRGCGPGKQDLDRITRSDRAMMRFICRISRDEPCSILSLSATLELAEIGSGVRARRLRWHGHVQRLMAIETSWLREVLDVVHPA